MTGEIRNPDKLPADLYPAEREFVRCLAEGKPCRVGNGELPEKEIESGDGANVVRGQVIRFFAYGGNDENPVLGPDIYLRGAWIPGDLILMHASIPYALHFSNCHFVASVVMLYMECVALYLNGSRLTQRLLADGLTTKGNVSLSRSFSAEGEVRLVGADIGKDLSCAGGKFHNPGKYALSADRLRTRGDVNLQDGFSAKGEVRLLGANISGDLECEGGKFHNSDGNALHADGLTTKGSVKLRTGFSAKGEVRLLGANIGRDLSCAGGKFHNPGKYALSTDGLTTKGNVNLSGGFSAEGEVRLVGVNISRNLDCTDGKFHNPGGNALAADGLTVEGNVNLSGNFSAEGEVRLVGASISGDLNCTGGKFHNADGYALNIDKGKISDVFFWWKTICTGGVSLVYTRADVLADAPDSWEACKVVLDGFTYNRFVNHKDIESRLRWLDNRPDKMQFSPLPYEQAAKVLFGTGHAHDARKILLEKERLQTKYGQMHQLRKFGRRLWGVFAGYGYRLSYTATWMAFFVAVGAVVFGVADRHGNIVPTHPVVAISDGYKMQIASNGDLRPTQAVPPEYPAFNPLMFSLDVFTPSAVFHQEDSWGPRSGGGDWLDFDVDILWFLTLWYWLEVAMGWILTSMLLLSVTGLLRPRQSSGEKD